MDPAPYRLQHATGAAAAATDCFAHGVHMIGGFPALVRSWLPLAMGTLGVVGALLYVIKDTQSWLAALILALSIVVFAWIIVHRDFGDSGAIHVGGSDDADGTRPNWLANRSAPIWLLIPALLTTIATGALAEQDWTNR